MKTSQKSCAFHPKQQLVNFCRNMECLLPMCPVCIKIHTAEHQDLKTHGSYDCISDIYCEVQRNLQHSLKKLVEQSSNIQSIVRREDEVKNELILKLGQTKSRIMDNTLHFVNQMQKDILQEFSNQSKIRLEQIKNIDQKIGKVSEQVQKEIQGLHSEKSLKVVISHLSSNLQAFYSFEIEKIKDSIKKIGLKETRLSKKIDNQGLNEILMNIGNYYYKRYLAKPFSKLSDGDSSQSEDKSKDSSDIEIRQNRPKKAVQLKQSIISKLSKQWQTQTSYHKALIIQP